MPARLRAVIIIIACIILSSILFYFQQLPDWGAAIFILSIIANLFEIFGVNLKDIIKGSNKRKPSGFSVKGTDGTNERSNSDLKHSRRNMGTMEKTYR